MVLPFLFSSYSLFFCVKVLVWGTVNVNETKVDNMERVGTGFLSP